MFSWSLQWILPVRNFHDNESKRSIATSQQEGVNSDELLKNVKPNIDWYSATDWLFILFYVPQNSWKNFDILSKEVWFLNCSRVFWILVFSILTGCESSRFLQDSNPPVLITVQSVRNKSHVVSSFQHNQFLSDCTISNTKLLFPTPQSTMLRSVVENYCFP